MRILIPALALLAAVPAHAEPDRAEPQVYRLTDAQKAELVARNERADLSAPNEPLLNDRRVHGEVGVMIGTGGARGIYGAAAIPLGERGQALVAVESSRQPLLDAYPGIYPYGYSAWDGFQSPWPLQSGPRYGWPGRR